MIQASLYIVPALAMVICITAAVVADEDVPIPYYAELEDYPGYHLPPFTSLEQIVEEMPPEVKSHLGRDDVQSARTINAWLASHIQGRRYEMTLPISLRDTWENRASTADSDAMVVDVYMKPVVVREGERDVNVTLPSLRRYHVDRARAQQVEDRPEDFFIVETAYALDFTRYSYKVDAETGETTFTITLIGGNWGGAVVTESALMDAAELAATQPAEAATQPAATQPGATQEGEWEELGVDAAVRGGDGCCVKTCVR